jgi:hypothetical protein
MSDDEKPRVEVEVGPLVPEDVSPCHPGQAKAYKELGPVQDLDAKVDDLYGNSTCEPISFDGLLIGAEVTHVMPAERAKEIWSGTPFGSGFPVPMPEPLKRIHEWKSVKFIMQADQVVKGLGGPKVRQIIGRALGERDDDQTFSAYVDIPWTFPEDYNWQRRAKLRLDSFLYDSCKCEARGSEVKICDTHAKVAYIWQDQDREEIREYEGLPADMPGPQRGHGPLSKLLTMHSLYPWVKLDTVTNEWVCLLCGFRQDAMMNQSTWRNQFIKKHGACGIANPDTILPASVEDKVLRELGRRLEEEYRQTGNVALDTTRAWILNQAGSIAIEEKPKKELGDGGTVSSGT